MSQIAERVHTDPRMVALLEERAFSLKDEALVEMVLEDGRCIRGVVVALPTIQVFHDAQGNEGHNALVRLDDANDPRREHYVWLDSVVSITQVGTA
ncbi:DUF3247 family protein [Luteimonas aquatica]|uniref:DUF3247 family protein n=1 Tax=Luteimonas aquatica TaxID=450364 RepID=UPI001F5787F3|nr:DUF3247 family protein [Luteimonas aquatica]